MATTHDQVEARIEELSKLAHSYETAAELLTKIRDLEVALFAPNAKLIDKEQKMVKLTNYKREFNDLQIVHIFARDI